MCSRFLRLAVGLVLLLSSSDGMAQSSRNSTSSRSSSGAFSNAGSSRSSNFSGGPFSRSSSFGRQSVNGRGSDTGSGSFGSGDMGLNSMGGSPLQGDGSLSPLGRSDGGSGNTGRLQNRSQQQRSNIGTQNSGRNQQSRNRQGLENMQQSQFGMQQYRPRVVVQTTFPTLPPEPTRVAAAATTVLGPETLPGGRNIQATVDGGAVTLTGTVSSQHEARLAAALMSLEPGVRTIRNELKVAPPESPPRE